MCVWIMSPTVHFLKIEKISLADYRHQLFLVVAMQKLAFETKLVLKISRLTYDCTEAQIQTIAS